MATAYREPCCSCPVVFLSERRRYRSPRTYLVQFLVHGLDLGQVTGVVAESFGVACGLRVQPGGVLRMDELADRVRQVAVTRQLTKLSHRLLVGAEADSHSRHTTTVRQALSGVPVIRNLARLPRPPRWRSPGSPLPRR